MFRQYRKIEPNEFFLVGCDTSMGAGDYCTAQFISKTKLDVPLVYQSKSLATEMTNEIFPVLEAVQRVTGIRPVVAYERNNGGVFELDRLASLNRSYRYEVFKMPTYGTVRPEETVRLGWDTNSATRPRMLSDLKDAIDKMLIKIYDRPTINELFSIVTVQTTSSWKAQAERHAHDDLCFVAGTKIRTNKGQVNIEDIKPGDMVRTRRGYKTVIHTSARESEVITRLGLTGTPNHPIMTTRGEVSLDKVSSSDTIYIWNEKHSSITIKNITDTLLLKGVNSESISGDTTSGNNLQWRYTAKSGWTNMGQSRKDLLSTIKMKILSTTQSIILLWLKMASIVQVICLHQRDAKSPVKMPKGSITFTGNLKRQYAKNVIKNSHLLAKEGQSFAQYCVGKEIGGKKVEKVYNLQVAECPEYFANNILVHNCMALAIAWQLYQLCDQPIDNMNLPMEPFVSQEDR